MPVARASGVRTIRPSICVIAVGSWKVRMDTRISARGQSQPVDTASLTMRMRTISRPATSSGAIFLISMEPTLMSARSAMTWAMFFEEKSFSPVRAERTTERMNSFSARSEPASSRLGSWKTSNGTTASFSPASSQ